MAFNFSSTAGTSGVSTVTISATSNSELYSIVENFTLSNSNGQSLLMAIAQRAYEPLGKYISFEPSDIVWDASGGTGSLRINSNDDWVITSNGWITLSRFEENRETVNMLSGNGNTIVGIRCGENTGTTRNGSITGYCISDSSITASTTVSQSGNYVAPYIIVDGEYIAESSGETVTVSVSANTTWSVISSDRWIDLQTQSGSGDGSITFIVAPNTSDFNRSADITVYNYEDDVYSTLKVLQPKNEDKQYIILSPMSFNVASSGSNNTISISANCEYDITTDVQWITLNASSGSGDGSVSFTTMANSGSSDVGNIVFSNSALSRNVTVQRESVGHYLSANTTSIALPTSQGDAEIAVYSNIEWVAYVDTDSDSERNWVTITPTSGSGNGTIRLSVTSAETNRNCTIVVYNSEYGLSWSVRLSQTSPRTIMYTSTDGNIVVPSNLPNVVSNTYQDGAGVITCSQDITEIPITAFTRAYTLETIILPNTVETIGNLAFAYCTSLKEFSIDDNVTSLGGGALGGTGIYDVYIGSGITTIEQFTFRECENLAEITIPSNITRIKGSSFYDCNSLSSITIENGIETIGQQAFLNVNGLETISIPQSVTGFSSNAIYNCQKLTEIYCYATTAPSGGYYIMKIAENGVFHYPNGSDYSVYMGYPQFDGWTFVDDL